jgi:hypothetical protein
VAADFGAAQSSELCKGGHAVGSSGSAPARLCVITAHLSTWLNGDTRSDLHPVRKASTA